VCVTHSSGATAKPEKHLSCFLPTLQVPRLRQKSTSCGLPTLQATRMSKNRPRAGYPLFRRDHECRKIDLVRVTLSSGDTNVEKSNSCGLPTLQARPRNPKNIFRVFYPLFRCHHECRKIDLVRVTHSSGVTTKPEKLHSCFLPTLQVPRLRQKSTSCGLPTLQARLRNPKNFIRVFYPLFRCHDLGKNRPRAGYPLFRRDHETRKTSFVFSTHSSGATT
jgi:hypothetical protein